LAPPQWLNNKSKGKKMTSNADKIQRELEGTGLATTRFQAPTGKEVIAFDYTIETGSHKGANVRVGVSDPDGKYPEYPPHWLHVSPPIDDGKGGAVERYETADGRQWLAMSRPPADIWDRLKTKHMSTYIREHLPRVWKDV
jgi:hypothetical protein